jgi:hypothetical protein
MAPTGTTRKEDSMAKFPRELEDATRKIKEHAAKQKIQITLSEEQAHALLSQWKDRDPRAPAEISFHVEGRERINMKVAGYWYADKSCCV